MILGHRPIDPVFTNDFDHPTSKLKFHLHVASKNNKQYRKTWLINIFFHGENQLTSPNDVTINTLKSLRFFNQKKKKKKNRFAKLVRDYVHIHLKKFAFPLNIYIYSVCTVLWKNTTVCTTAALRCLTITYVLFSSLQD